MSLQYCNYHNQMIDTDTDAEHFNEDGFCEEEKQDLIDHKIKQDLNDPSEDDQE